MTTGRRGYTLQFARRPLRFHLLTVQRIWEIFGKARVDLFASKDNSHCPIFFTRSTDALAHEWPSLPLCFSSSCSATAGTQTSSGITAQVDSNSPPLEEPTMGVGIIPAAESSSMADPLETGVTGPPLSSKRHDMASTARVMGPACLAARREPFILTLNTMAETRALSTRHLYALKWAIFSTWCEDRDIDPVTSDMSVVLSFLQEMLDKQRSSSTIKVYAAAIAAFHAPIAGRSVGRDSAVTQFLRGTRRMNPPRPRTVPPWDLSTAIRDLKGPPLEPLQSSSLRVLSLKNRPAVGTGVGQASRRPAGPFRQPCLPGIQARTPRLFWNQGWVMYLRCSPPHSEPRL